jgi:prephenate dehydrogenase
MEEPDFSTLRVAILGLGLMGGSLALGLRGRVREVRAADPDAKARALAVEMGIVDVVASAPAEILGGIDIIVLAAPVRANLALVQALPRLVSAAPAALPHLMPQDEVVVMDLGSTKTAICAAYAGLPEHFDPVGGHPMGGKEKGGLENADAAIFHGVTFALTALPRTTRRARIVAEGLARLLGSQPVWMEAQAHDRWAAATSHLPYLLANALALATPVESAALVGPGFRSTSRLAASFTPMMLDVLLSNRENVLEAAGRFRRELEALESALRQGDEGALRESLERSAQQHAQLVQANTGSEARV